LRYYDTSCLRGDGITMYSHHLHTIRCYLIQETRMYMGWGFQRFSRYLTTSCIKGGRTTPYGHDLIHTIRCIMLLDTRNENTHGLGVGVSMVFEIFGHLLYQRGQDHSVWYLTSHHHLLLDTRNKNIYGFIWVGISTVF
jgi:hypothetical protein